MRRKQILIGLFALIIHRTIGEPKRLQGGRERAFVTMCFFWAVTGGTGISGVVLARAVTDGTGANGLNVVFYMHFICQIDLAHVKCDV